MRITDTYNINNILSHVWGYIYRTTQVKST